MGRVFLEHLDGNILYHCVTCRTNLSNSANLVHTGFNGHTGPAFVFKDVVNVLHARPTETQLHTGRYFVRDVKCRRCRASLGWRYEYAFERVNRYKEGLTVIECSMMVKLNARGEMI